MYEFYQYSPAPVQKINPTRKQKPQTIPVNIGFLTRLNISISKIVHSMPSKIPIWDPSPSESSIVKNKTAQNGEPGSSFIACVKIMNARPVPSPTSDNMVAKLQSLKPQWVVFVELYFCTKSLDSISVILVVLINPCLNKISLLESKHFSKLTVALYPRIA